MSRAWLHGAARRVLVLLVFTACGSSPAVTMPAASPPPPPPPVEPPIAAGPAVPATIVEGERLALGGGAFVRFTSVVVEDIAASPDGVYPGGSGITLALVFEGVGAPVRRAISLLSAGYQSVSTAWFEDRRVTVVAVEDPLRTPRVVLLAERATDRPRPGTPVVKRLVVGDELALDGARIKFLGHSDKHVSKGPPPILLALEIREGRAPPVRSESHVGTEDQPTSWSWHDYRFTILEHAYNATMRVSIDRLELEPLALTRE